MPRLLLIPWRSSFGRVSVLVAVNVRAAQGHVKVMLFIATVFCPASVIPRFLAVRTWRRP